MEPELGANSTAEQIPRALHSGKARILIVDDELSNIRLLERLLAQAGFAQVESTLDPREVVQLVLRFSADLILLDLRMRRMSWRATSRSVLMASGGISSVWKKREWLSAAPCAVGWGSRLTAIA